MAGKVRSFPFTIFRVMSFSRGGALALPEGGAHVVQRRLQCIGEALDRRIISGGFARRQREDRQQRQQ